MANDFDLDHFRQLMARDGLRFPDEQSDVLNLFCILLRRRNGLGLKPINWLSQQLFPQVISTKRLREKLLKTDFLWTLVPRKRPLSRKQKQTALQFLAENHKHARGPSPKQKENSLATDVAGMGLLDEVINIILLLTFNKVDSANINEK